MFKQEARKKTILLLVITVCIVLNLYTFVQAYPEASVIDSGCCATQILAKDFSAYYIASWRIFHDPSNVYTQGAANDGEPPIYPQPEPFKYLPSFLIFTSPLLSLTYQNALTAFDLAQLILLPIIAFLLYELLQDKSILIIAVVMVIVLLQPSPTPHWGLSVSYYWQWAEGQDKVLNATLLLLCFYLGRIRRPTLSGIALGLGAFDPRFFLLALPLFAVYNRLDLKRAGISLVASLVLLNFPLLIDGVGFGFLQMVLQGGASTPLYYYALIPLLTLVSLIVLNAHEICLLTRTFISKFK
jgi:hypothetical protein